MRDLVAELARCEGVPVLTQDLLSRHLRDNESARKARRIHHGELLSQLQSEDDTSFLAII
jgi:hypothetical protein